jgi:hypothetical protein
MRKARLFSRSSAASGQIAILDLSLIPPDVLNIVIAVIARVVFEATQRYRKLHENELPTVLILEEAHSFIRRRVGEDAPAFGAAQMCRETASDRQRPRSGVGGQACS